jgi:hypothetical protein
MKNSVVTRLLFDMVTRVDDHNGFLGEMLMGVLIGMMIVDRGLFELSDLLRTVVRPIEGFLRFHFFHNNLICSYFLLKGDLTGGVPMGEVRDDFYLALSSFFWHLWAFVNGLGHEEVEPSLGLFPGLGEGHFFHLDFLVGHEVVGQVVTGRGLDPTGFLLGGEVVQRLVRGHEDLGDLALGHKPREVPCEALLSIVVFLSFLELCLLESDHDGPVGLSPSPRVVAFRQQFRVPETFEGLVSLFPVERLLSDLEIPSQEVLGLTKFFIFLRIPHVPIPLR